MNLFLEDLGRRLSLLRACVEAADASGIREHAHSLKGSSVSVGARRLAHALGRLERLATVDAASCLTRVDQEAAAARSALVVELSTEPRAEEALRG